MLPCRLVMKKRAYTLFQVASWPGMQASIFNLSQQKRELEESVAQGMLGQEVGEVLSRVVIRSLPWPRSVGYQPHRGTPAAYAEGDQRSENAPLLDSN